MAGYVGGCDQSSASSVMIWKQLTTFFLTVIWLDLFGVFAKMSLIGIPFPETLMISFLFAMGFQTILNLESFLVC